MPSVVAQYSFPKAVRLAQGTTATPTCMGCPDVRCLTALLIVAVLFPGIHFPLNRVSSRDASPALTTERSAPASGTDLTFRQAPSGNSVVHAGSQAVEADNQAQAPSTETYVRGASSIRGGGDRMGIVSSNSVNALEYQWKLGRMYAAGDGVKKMIYKLSDIFE
jgi:hypothetical protein